MNAPEPAAHEASILVPLDFIAESPTNPRTDFPVAEMAELADSIRRIGLIQPILLRPWPEKYPHQGANPPKFELVAGARRFRATREAGFTSIEAKVKDLFDNEVLEIQIIENLCRQDLHPMDEAHGYEQMIDHHHYTAESLAEKIGKSKGYIYGRLKLTALCHDARKAFREGKLTASTALLVARIPNEKLQIQATREITDPDWQGEIMSYRAAAKHLQNRYMLRLADATFSLTDTLLIKEAVSCEHCPKRTGNQPAELFEDVPSVDVCTDPDCFAAKRAAHTQRQIEQAQKAGNKTITGDEAKRVAPYGTGCYITDHTPLDGHCHEDPENRTYREILGDNTPPPTLIEDVRTGNLIEFVEDTALASALKKAGVVGAEEALQSRTERQEAYAKQQEKEAAERTREETFRKALFANVRNELVNRMREDGAGLMLEECRLVTARVLQAYEEAFTVAELWVKEEECAEEQDIVDVLVGRIATMSIEDLCLLQMDMALADQAKCYYNWRDEPPTALIESAKRLGLDPDEIRADLDCEVSGKAPRATKAARAASSNARGKDGEEQAPAVTEAPKPAAEEIKVGDRVRMNGGDEGTVERIRGKRLDVVIEKNGVRVTRSVPATTLEKLPDATQAAQAADQTATETEVVPVDVWPFPTTGFEKNRKAAADAAKGNIEKNEKPKAEVTA